MRKRIERSTLPPWAEIEKLLPIGSCHFVKFANVIDDNTRGKSQRGVFGCITCGESDFPCFIDADAFSNRELSSLIGETISVTVVAHHPDQKRIEFKPNGWSI